MAAGKLFAISFVIGAALGSDFNSTTTKGANVMQQLSEKTKMLNAEQKRLDNAWKTSQNQIKSYGQQLLALKTEYDKGKISKEQYQSTLQKLDSRIRQSGMNFNEYKKHLMKIRSEIDATRMATSRLKEAQVARDRAADNLSNAWSDLKSTTVQWGMIVAPFLGMGETAAEFEAAMSKVKAITRASKDEMNKLSSVAQQLGADTRFSASQAADAMSYLGMAGWNTNQIISGMPGLLALAAAGGTDLARTADIISDDLTAFGLSADQASHMADVFATTITKTNTNVEMLGDTMKYAAPVARAFGLSLEETSAIAGIMAGSSIKAGMAGTAIRAGLLRLSGPPKMAASAMDALGVSLDELEAEQQEAAEGLAMMNIQLSDTNGPRKMSAILTELRNKTADLSNEQRLATVKAIFGQEAATAWLAVLDSEEGLFENLVKDMENSHGVAEEIAKDMMDNAKGAWEELKSAIESLSISIGSLFLPAVKDIFQTVTGLVRSLTEWVKNHKEITKNVIAVGGAILSTIFAIKLWATGAAFVTFFSATMALYKRTIGVTAVEQKGFTKALQNTKSVLGSMYNTLKKVGNSAWLMVKNISFEGAFKSISSVFAIVKNISLGGVFKSLIAGFRSLSSILSIVGRAVMLNPIGATLTAIAGIALLIYNNWYTVGPYFISLWESIKATFNNAIASIQPAIERLSTAWANISAGISPAVEIVMPLLSKLADVFGVILLGAIVTFANIATGIINLFINQVSTVFTGLTDTLTGVINFINGVFSQDWELAWQGVSDIFKGVFGTIKDIAYNVLDGIKNTIKGIAEAFDGLSLRGSKTSSTSGISIDSNARGGIYNKGAFLTTFAEKSAEAAIPIDGSSRARGLWEQAGELNGFSRSNLITSSPNISVNVPVTINGTADKSVATDIGQTVEIAVRNALRSMSEHAERVSYA